MTNPQLDSIKGLASQSMNQAKTIFDLVETIERQAQHYRDACEKLSKLEDENIELKERIEQDEATIQIKEAQLSNTKKELDSALLNLDSSGVHLNCVEEKLKISSEHLAFITSNRPDEVILDYISGLKQDTDEPASTITRDEYVIELESKLAAAHEKIEELGVELETLRLNPKLYKAFSEQKSPVKKEEQNKIEQ